MRRLSLMTLNCCPRETKSQNNQFASLLEPVFVIIISPTYFLGVRWGIYLICCVQPSFVFAPLSFPTKSPCGNPKKVSLVPLALTGYRMKYSSVSGCLASHFQEGHW